MNKKTLMSFGRTAAMGSMLLFGGAFIAGCGDETTEVTEKLGLAVVEEGEEMPECTAENEGDMIYVKDEKQTYACEDEEWVSLKGEAGENGSSCTVKQLKDKSGYELTCGGEKIGTIKNGEKGDDGDEGSAGASCSAKELKDKSGYELTCGGKKVGTIKNGGDGEEGAAGTSCTGAANEDGSVTISCDGKVVGTIKNGTDGKSAYELAKEADPTIGSVTDWLASLKGAAGTSCSATKVADGAEIKCGTAAPIKITDGDAGLGCTSTDDGEGTITVTCGDDKVEFYQAVCLDGTPYNPETHVCYDEAYDDKDKKYYSVAVVRCKNQSVVDDDCDANDDCSMNSYNPKDYFCDNDVLTPLCEEVDKEGNKTYSTYNGATQYCDEEKHQVADKEPCGKGTTLMKKPTEYCYTTNDNPEVRIADKPNCDGKLYNPVTHYCDGTAAQHITKKEICGSSTDELNIDIRHTAGAVDVNGDGAICDTYKGVTQRYKIKKIGERVWMAQNLNRRYTQATAGTAENPLHLDSTSFCYGDGMMVAGEEEGTTVAAYTADEIAANCAKYGRLYTWSAAIDSAKLALADPDNPEYCGYGVDVDKCKTIHNTNYQGICPDGWHLPGATEAANLDMGEGGTPYYYNVDFRVDDKEMYDVMEAEGAIDWTKLEWDYGEAVASVGKNSSGFSALPSGKLEYKSDKWTYSEPKKYFAFWQANEYNSEKGHYFYIDNASSRNSGETSKKYNAFAIRCVQNVAE
jgi:uncharacterized protein (TIGR02145 family)